MNIYGYSRGGNTAVLTAQEFASSNIQLTVVTIDPHNIVGSLILPSNATGLNFYQRNPRSWTGGIFPWGQNPYKGSPVEGAENIKITDKSVNHVNIVDEVTETGSANRQKIDALNATCKQ